MGGGDGDGEGVAGGGGVVGVGGLGSPLRCQSGRLRTPLSIPTPAGLYTGGHGMTVSSSDSNSALASSSVYPTFSLSSGSTAPQVVSLRKCNLVTPSLQMVVTLYWTWSSLLTLGPSLAPMYGIIFFTVIMCRSDKGLYCQLMYPLTIFGKCLNNVCWFLMKQAGWEFMLVQMCAKRDCLCLTWAGPGAGQRAGR